MTDYRQTTGIGRNKQTGESTQNLQTSQSSSGDIFIKSAKIISPENGVIPDGSGFTLTVEVELESNFDQDGFIRWGVQLGSNRLGDKLTSVKSGETKKARQTFTLNTSDVSPGVQVSAYEVVIPGEDPTVPAGELKKDKDNDGDGKDGILDSPLALAGIGAIGIGAIMSLSDN